MINRRDDTPKSGVGGQGSGVTETTGATSRLDDRSKRATDDSPDVRLPVKLPFGASTDAPLEDLPVPGDSHSKHSYYYDDATNYKIYQPDEDDE